MEGCEAGNSKPHWGRVETTEVILRWVETSVVIAVMTHAGSGLRDEKMMVARRQPVRARAYDHLVAAGNNQNGRMRDHLAITRVVVAVAAISLVSPPGRRVVCGRYRRENSQQKGKDAFHSASAFSIVRPSSSGCVLLSVMTHSISAPQ